MLNRLLYWCVIKPISLLPYPMLYGFSDFLFFIFYYVIPYRKKVVLSNLERSFPEKRKNEITAISKAFYRHFCDLVLESLKNFSIKEADAQKRMEQIDTDVMNRLHDQGKSVIMVGGHCGNWELWAVATAPHFHHKLVGIYKKLSNPYFDKKMRDSRSKFGLQMIPTRETAEYIKTHQDELIAPVIALDQSPGDPKKCVWINFLGQDTATHYGAEKFAKEYNYPVVFGHIYKLRRGFYQARYELVTENPREMGYGELIAKVSAILEEDVRKAPEHWLWTHKRWKHKRPVQENFPKSAL